MSNIDIQLMLRLEIFLAQYAYELDDRNVEYWVDFFLPDGIYQLTTSHNESNDYPLGIIFCKGHGMMIDRIQALQTANIFEVHKYTHILTKPVAKLRNNILHCRSNFVVYRTMDSKTSEIFVTGKYLDQIHLTDDGMKFIQRKAVVDSKIIDTLMVYPI